MYNVKLYSNTGFNAVNIPDKASRLPEQNSYTCPALDIYQARELSRFSIRISPGMYTDIQNADYLYLQNDQVASDFAYYSIQNITMTSNDVAVLDVTMDYILTAGGVEALEFLDGMCERHHVAVADDIFGKYDEADPYLTPAEMMKIEESVPSFWDSDNDKENITILESTIALEDIGDYITNNLAGLDYESIGGNVCTVPTPPTVPYDTTARMSIGNNIRSTIMPKVGFYLTSNNVQGQTIDWLFGNLSTQKQGAIARIRGLSMESAIIAQYAIPKYMIDLNNTFQIGNKGVFIHLHGKKAIVDLASLPFLHIYTHQVKNKRVYYGDNCSYHIVSIASGNEAKFLPEEIYNYSSPKVCPTIEMRVDPRPKGCPYFRFDVYRGNSDYDMFFTNAVKGLEWQNVPLVYQGGSGSLIDQYKFNAQQAINRENLNFSLNQNALAKEQSEVNTTIGMLGNISGALGSAAVGQFGGMVDEAAGFFASMINQDYTSRQYSMSAEHAKNSFDLARRSELGSLLISNNVVAPSMNFPISEGIRDFVGNHCIVYRTYYTENDVARIDKILTMYGYRHTTPITTALLTNRSKFNYIQARGVSIKNTNIPKWIRDGIAMQFENGTRIWHQLPDPTCYTDGTNV